MPDPSQLTVVIPTRDRWPILARTLDALRAQTVHGFGIVVVVDGRDQEVPDLGGVDVLVRPQGGPGAARNAGVAAVETPLVLLLGDDMVPTPALVERHLAAHERWPGEKVGVLGRVEWHPDVRPGRLHRWLDWSGAQFEFASIQGDVAGWGHFYSCNVSLRRDLFLEVGGFDERFAFYYEDLDLAWRLHEHGFELRYERDALTRHLHPYDWAALERRFTGVARGERQMAAKHTWFAPHFESRARWALGEPHVSRAWPIVADRVPLRAVRRRADRWYWSRLGASFLRSWDTARDLEELQAYLGDRYDHASLTGHASLVEREERAAPDERTFYRTSEAYLYDLTVFAMTGTKDAYLDALRRHVPPGARVLDYGCGIGSDGLRLLEAGYRVAFGDFDNPSTRYLRWRLERRGLDAPVYDVDRPADIPDDFDAAYSFDVIEHVDDPFAFLAELERHAAIVCVNFLEPDPADTDLHKPLPIHDLLAHTARRGQLHYARHHGRSHLVIYRATRS